MRRADAEPRTKHATARSIQHNTARSIQHANARSIPLSTTVLTLCFVLTLVPAAPAQSGRRGQTSTPPDATAPTDTSAPSDAAAQTGMRPRRAGRSARESAKDSPHAFIIMTAAPGSPSPFDSDPNAAYFYHPPGREAEAGGGCLNELRSVQGARVVQDEDVARWEAREAALGESDAWVIWMELRWDKATTSAYDPTPFRLRYLLFEPGTGRIVASGTGRGVKQTWGRSPSRRETLEEVVRRAGQDVAAQVLSELKR